MSYGTARLSKRPGRIGHCKTTGHRAEPLGVHTLLFNLMDKVQLSGLTNKFCVAPKAVALPRRSWTAAEQPYKN